MQSLMGRGCVRNLRPHLVSPVETPKTALHRLIKISPISPSPPSPHTPPQLWVFNWI
ncbi:hypothetical protein [Moorena producens]|uniref:hypothetical protein n=1 Tax=Moorena producens TaxID=1155739 RepID=UPI0013144677|nr:hypothetical protein [Moorena producens]